MFPTGVAAGLRYNGSFAHNVQPERAKKDALAVMTLAVPVLSAKQPLVTSPRRRRASRVDVRATLSSANSHSGILDFELPAFVAPCCLEGVAGMRWMFASHPLKPLPLRFVEYPEWLFTSVYAGAPLFWRVADTGHVENDCRGVPRMRCACDFAPLAKRGLLDADEYAIPFDEASGRERHCSFL